MTTQHTPGPWTAEITHDSTYARITNELYGLLATISRPTEASAVAADARLIAAAPELLAALREIAEETIPGKTDRTAYEQRLADIILSARAAIAKAGGQS